VWEDRTNLPREPLSIVIVLSFPGVVRQVCEFGIRVQWCATERISQLFAQIFL